MPGAQEIAAWLEELADRVAFAGEGQWKARAYREAAERIAAGAVDLSDQRGLEQAPGIGPKIAGKIRAMLEGELPPSLVRLRREQPQELGALLRLPGIGPTTARKLWQAGIGTVSELERSIEGGGPLAGLTQSQRRHLEGAFGERRRGIPLPDLLAATAALRRAVPGAEPAGPLRMLEPTVAEPLWFAPDDPQAKAAWRDMQPFVLSVGYRIAPERLVFVPKETLGPVLLTATGPASFLAEVREALGRRGLRIEGGGLYRDDARIACASEEEVFRHAQMEPVPAPLRGLTPERRALAPQGAAGDLHTHSTWSDGAEDIRTMAAAALARGYRYLAVTDHSQGLKIANGLSPERYRQQRKEIQAVQAELPDGFRLLQGCEVDIHADGSLDLPDDLLQELDVVVASVHGQFDQGAEQATARLLEAIRHPLVSCIGHPGARKLGLRPPIAADWPRVFAAARKYGTALELNASPRRLDLDYRWLAGIDLSGLTFQIDTDAHAVEELSYMPLGIAQAQKAGIAAKDVRNAGPVERVLQRKQRP